MKIVISLLIVGLFLFSFSFVSYAKPCASKEDIEALVSGNNTFSINLYKILSKENANDNIFISPFSIDVALAITYVGAAGDTAIQMEKVLELPFSSERLHRAFSGLIGKINEKGKGYVLNIANALWADKGYKFKEKFIETIKNYYYGGFRTLSFRTDPEGSREKINRWVENKTHDKIKNLLPPRSITSLTRLVITNAIYFKGDWMHSFKKEATRPIPFYPSPEGKINVPMMYQKESFFYGEKRGKYQTLILPYGKGTLSMVILLPSKRDGIFELERELTWEELVDAVSHTNETKVKVYIPKFRVERTYNLVNTLSTMGMPSAFTDEADFSNMEPKRELYISDVVHKAYIEVNEKGTEAAGATGVVITLKSMIPEERIPIFRADHPFLYFIIHNPTGQILFMGRIIDPTK